VRPGPALHGDRHGPKWDGRVPWSWFCTAMTLSPRPPAPNDHGPPHHGHPKRWPWHPSHRLWGFRTNLGGRRASKRPFPPCSRGFCSNFIGVLPRCIDVLPRRIDEMSRRIDVLPHCIDETPRCIDTLPRRIDESRRRIDDSPRCIDDSPRRIDDWPPWIDLPLPRIDHQPAMAPLTAGHTAHAREYTESPPASAAARVPQPPDLPKAAPAPASKTPPGSAGR
jgi:hypothetical protein